MSNVVAAGVLILRWVWRQIKNGFEDPLMPLDGSVRMGKHYAQSALIDYDMRGENSVNLQDFKPGQTVYILNRERKLQIIEREIESVGRKYVTIAGNWAEQYFIRHETENFLVEKVNFGYSKYLFPTKEALNLYLERQELESKIRRDITNVLFKMSIGQLRQIAGWMDEA